VLLCRRNIEPRHGLWTCLPDSWSWARPPRRVRVRETAEEAGAHIELLPLFTVLNVVPVGQVHFFYRATMLDTQFDPGSGDHRSPPVPQSEIPWEEIAFRTVKLKPCSTTSRTPSGSIRHALRRYRLNADRHR
jgi:ADP-ribose pyrophosphatase YjhB (NUDIX family)